MWWKSGKRLVIANEAYSSRTRSWDRVLAEGTQGRLALVDLSRRPPSSAGCGVVALNNGTPSWAIGAVWLAFSVKRAWPNAVFISIVGVEAASDDTLRVWTTCLKLNVV